MKFLVAGLAALVAIVLCLNSPRAAEGDISIKDVMKKAHKDGLLKKVISGDAGDDERKELVTLYVALSKQKPPKGDEDDWKKRTGQMVKAAKAAEKDASKGKALGKIVNCGACHKLHK
jgi:hypothetical protein